MDSVYGSNVSGTAPAAPAVPLVGFPRAGNSLTGEKATRPGPYWYHMITQELRNVVVAAGLTPDASDLDQVLQALRAMFLDVSKAYAVGQDWVSLTGSRVLGTTYYNTTDRPISVAVALFVPSSGAAAQALVDGVLVPGSSANVGAWATAKFEVPPGKGYLVQGTIAGATLQHWSELR